MTEPNEAAARDFLALVKLVQEGEWDLSSALIGSFTPSECISALVSGAAQAAFLLKHFAGDDGGRAWVVERLTDLGTR